MKGTFRLILITLASIMITFLLTTQVVAATSGLDNSDGPLIVKKNFLRESAQITDYGAEVAREMLARAYTENITEADVVLEIETKMVEKGSSEYVEAFGVIVASGEQSALPHGDASDDSTNMILPDEVVVVDLGARYRGYCTDLTRTFFMGQPTEEMMNIYNITLEAQDAGMNAVTAMENGHNVDKAARDVIDAAGYGENFTHGLGHGIGFNVHTYPFIGPGSDDILFQTTDMCISIEPGIYLEGRYGIRIEDDVMVLRSGFELITHAPKDLESAIIINEWADNITDDSGNESLPKTEGISFPIMIGIALGAVVALLIVALVVKKIRRGF
jgi:Xaa-Pro aminopeptidase